MKIRSQALILTFLLAFNAHAQETRTAVSMIDSARRHNDTQWSWDVFAARTNPTLTIQVGISSFYFNYNSTALATPTLTYVNPNYSGDGSGNYAPMTVQTVNDGGVLKVAVTINYVGNLGPGTSLPTTQERLFRVTMTILNQSAVAGLAWDEPNSAITASNPVFIQNVFLGGNNGPLPVQLSSFTATEEEGRGIRLRWTTISEINNYGFFVQRRRSGEASWVELVNSFIAGHGTTNEPHTYAYLDNTAQPGSWQYRLRQVDLNGTEHYTEPISINSLTAVRELAPVEYALKQNYPNPFNPSTEIKFSVEQVGRTTLEVFNTVGQRVAMLYDDVAEPGYLYSARFDATNIASGTYFYRIQSGRFVQTKKMLLVR
jgi:hypothetical protein